MLTLHLGPPNAASVLSSINSLVYVFSLDCFPAYADHILNSCDVDINAGQMCGIVCTDQPTVSYAYAQLHYYTNAF